MKNKIILVFIGFLFFQITNQISLLNYNFVTPDICEETGDEGNHKEDLKQDLKITNIILSNKENDWFTYQSSNPLHFQTLIITATYQSVETPPPNKYFILYRAA